MTTTTPAPTTTATAPLRRWPATGLLLTASGVLATVGATILSVSFGWPAVLDEPGTTVLPLFAASETSLRAGFYLMLVSSLVLVPAAFGLEAALTRATPGTRAMTVFGVAGALFQILGWVRWPITVPFLADAYAQATDAAGRQAVAASFDVLNRYGGGALGEHLGWLFQGVWAVFVGVVVVRAVGVPRWFGALGLALAAVWAVLVPGAAVLRSEAMNTIGQPVYTAWYVWLLALGVLLVVRRVGPASTVGVTATA
ncbi:DUF4386 family protein [Kineosporia sp. A_224]|uniref:DUF4386 family protein n=1 Tax=Kineosporia sp. A_224 TaxID=1962180 RepID=UPI00130451C5|nr:DUF4386 family protein [Kineosporia sp. A_224]